MVEPLNVKNTKLYQILSGKIAGKRENYPLFEWLSMIDFFLAFYENFCSSAEFKREKAIAMFNKRFEKNIRELKSLMINRNDFEILKTIGKGHFGEVHVVKEKDTQNVYAMKVLKKSATLAQDNMAFFTEERDVMAFANSDWVTKLHYSFQDLDNLYLVMEFLPGGDLLSLLNRYDDSILDEKTCQFYLSEIIIATNCVHKIGYVHRDIKPENILLDLTGHVKLADFGSAAKLINGKQVFGEMPVGTPEYIAPEVLTSMDSGGGKYGPECDYWSIGIVAYEMLFGLLPFEADSVLQLYSQIMDFEKSLKFPDDVVVTETTVHLLKSLICHQKTRINYSGLASHDFFKIPPPFVPELNSSTDTSNFEALNTLKPVTGTTKAGSAKDFPLKHTMPFIGFTFSRDLYKNFQNDLGSLSHRQKSLSVADEMPFQQSTIDKSILEKSHVELKNAQVEVENSKKLLENLKIEVKEMLEKSKKLENEKNYFMNELNKQKENSNNGINKISEMEILLKEQRSFFCGFIEDLHNAFNLGSIEIPDNIFSLNLTSIILQIKKLINKLKEGNELAKTDVEKSTQSQKALEERLEMLLNQQQIDEERYHTTYAELKDSMKKLQDLLEKNTFEYQAKISKLMLENNSANDRINDLQNKLSKSEINSIEKNNKSLGVLKSDLDTATTSINALKDENNKLRTETQTLNARCSTYRQEISNLNETHDKVSNEYESEKLKNLKLNQNLSELTMKLDSMQRKVEYLNKMKDDQSNENSVLAQLNISLTDENNFLKDSQSKLIEKNESLKLTQIRNEKAFNDKINLQSENHKILQANYNELLIKCESLERELNLTVADNENLKAMLNSEKTLSKSIDETVKNYENTISAQKLSNYSLQEKIEELTNELTNAELNANLIQNQFDSFKQSSSESHYLISETIKQQTKLIEFLQSSKSKKKTKINPMSDTVIKTMQNLSKYNSYNDERRDLKAALELERHNTIKLQSQLQRALEKIEKMKNQQYSSSPRQSFNNMKLDNTEQDQILHTHNIHESSPVGSFKKLNSLDSSQLEGAFIKIHKTDSTNTVISNLKTSSHSMKVFSGLNTVCQICFAPIRIYSSFYLCNDCHLCCHETCDEFDFFKCAPNDYSWSSFIPSTNSIPQVLVNVKSHNLPLMGWINTPLRGAKLKHEWESKYMVLTSEALKFFRTEVSSEIALSMDERDGEVYLIDEGVYEIFPSINMSIPNVYQTTLRKSPKLKPILYMTTDNIEDKLMWVIKFREVFNNYTKIDKIKFTQLKHFSFQNLGVLICSIQIDQNLVAIGTEKGLVLFSTIQLKNSEEQKTIHGFSCVLSMVVIGEFLFMIHDGERNLLKLEIKLLLKKFKSQKNETINPKEHIVLEKYSGLRYLAANKINGEKILAFGTSTHVAFAKISGSNVTFVNSVTFEESVTNVISHTNKFTILTNKITSIHFPSMEKRNFLDSNDKTLAFNFVNQMNQTNNWLLRMFELEKRSGNNSFSISKDNREYLLCNTEFGVFINEEGSRSREGELIWNGVPLQFGGNLYVTYYDRVSIITICDEKPSTIMYFVFITVESHTHNRIMNCENGFIDSPRIFCATTDGVLLSGKVLENSELFICNPLSGGVNDISNRKLYNAPFKIYIEVSELTRIENQPSIKHHQPFFKSKKSKK